MKQSRRIKQKAAAKSIAAPSKGKRAAAKAEPSPAGGTWREAGWLGPAQIALIVAAVFVVYLPAWHAGFVWDDEPLITTNPLLRTLSGLREIWMGSRTADYFPLTNSFFWLEHQVFGENAMGYHLVNIFLQAANSILVWRVLRRLRIPGAFLTGLIFALHPVHVESVAWISELKNVLSMFFGLLALLCFLEVKDERFFNRRTAYAVSLFFFLLALLAKTQLVVLPAVLFLCEWWRQKSLGAGWFWRAVRRTAPFFAVGLLLGVVTIWFQNRGIGEEQIALGGFDRRLVNAGLAIWFYAKQVFVPYPLMAVYPAWRFDSPTFGEWLPLLALVAALAALWWGRERLGRGPILAAACFVIALLPVVGLIRMAYARSGTLVADHLQYFADVPLIALGSAGLTRAWNATRRDLRNVMSLAIAVLLVAMGAYTWTRAAVFQSEETLWQDNFTKNPDAWQGHNRLGELYFREERFAEAATHFERAARLKPELAGNHNWLGLAYCRVGRFEEGIEEYRTAIRLSEKNPAAVHSQSMATIHTNLANVLALTANHLNEAAQRVSGLDAEMDQRRAMERFHDAVAQYQKALAISPDQPAVHRNLGILLANFGQTNEAIFHLRRTLELVPNEPAARETLEAIEAQRR